LPYLLDDLSRLITSKSSFLSTFKGPNREVKKAVESYWAFKTSAEDLEAAVKQVRKQRWQSIADKGVDSIPS
jgi:hypothetical protein